VTVRRVIVGAALFVTGCIHLLPLPGVLGGERLSMLYGVVLDDPALELLLKHRAVLFGLLGSVLVVAAWRPGMQPMAVLAGLISVVSFLLFASGSSNAAIQRVVVVDLFALGLLLAAGALLLFSRRDALLSWQPSSLPQRPVRMRGARRHEQ
jgi:hypothetical protein